MGKERTLESLFGYCDALQEMLMQEHQGYLHLFPAIPDEWREEKISFKNLRSYGGILVSAKWKQGKVEEVAISSKKEQPIKIKNVFEKDILCVKTKFGTEKIVVQNGMFEFSLKIEINKIVKT